MKPATVLLCAVWFCGGFAVRDTAAPLMAQESQARLAQREQDCKSKPGALAMMARLPGEPETAARCLQIGNDAPPKWWKFFEKRKVTT